MDIKLTKDQYENLVKLVYLGNWMINGIRLHNEQVKKYEELEQYIFSFAKDGEMEKYIEYDTNSKKFFPTKELEMESDIENYRQEYEDEVFWEELADRLARRDFIRKYGEDSIKKMDRKERFEKEEPFVEKYEEEFEKYGIERIDIK